MPTTVMVIESMVTSCLTYLGHLGQNDKNRNAPIYVAPPKEAMASRGDIMLQYH